MKKIGAFLSVVIMLGVTPVLFAQKLDSYPRMEKHKEGAIAQQNYIERKVADAQAARAKNAAISQEIRQASDELFSYTWSLSIPYGSSEYRYLQAMWETLGARNETNHIVEVEEHEVNFWKNSVSFWKTRSVFCRNELKQAERELQNAQKILSDKKAATTKKYNAKKAEFEQLKKKHPALAKKYADLEKRLHL